MTNVAFSPATGGRVLSTCIDNRLRVWEGVSTLGGRAPPREIVHSHDFGRYVARTHVHSRMGRHSTCAFPVWAAIRHVQTAMRGVIGVQVPDAIPRGVGPEGLAGAPRRVRALHQRGSVAGLRVCDGHHVSVCVCVCVCVWGGPVFPGEDFNGVKLHPVDMLDACAAPGTPGLVAQLHDDALTTIATVNVFHPTRDAVATGAGVHISVCVCVRARVCVRACVPICPARSVAGRAAPQGAHRRCSCGSRGAATGMQRHA